MGDWDYQFVNGKEYPIDYGKIHDPNHQPDYYWKIDHWKQQLYEFFWLFHGNDDEYNENKLATG